MRRPEFVTFFGEGLPTSRRWLSGTAIAAVVGVIYYLAARLGVGLILKPEGVAVFWPAAGISSGLLIVLGRWARWPVSAGVIAATVAVHLAIADPLWAGAALGVCNATEALVVAGLIERYFGDDFALDRLREVIGLVIAAVVATTISGIGGAVTYRLLSWSSAEMLTSWQHWFASDVIGIIIVAPLVIALAAALRRPLPHSELLEGAVALLALAIMTAVAITFPQELWVTVLPITALFPILLWVTARCAPVYAAAAAFLVSMAFVTTAVFGIGHFGDATIRFADRVLQAQFAILLVALGTFVLAALFAQRRESEALLARSNTLLERERDNKLLNFDAITASIAHEIRQPLAAISLNADAALAFLTKTPIEPQLARDSLIDIVEDGQRAGKIVEGIRSLFKKADGGSDLVDLNRVALDVLHSLHGELLDQRVVARTELASGLPLVSGNKNQLHQAVFNLVHNAIEAMSTTPDRDRVLRLTTNHREPNTIVLVVEDSGAGVDPQRLDGMFEAFVTTKPNGTGLGLAICREIINRHGGKLSASSDGKNGARFEFILPASPQAGKATICI